MKYQLQFKYILADTDLKNVCCIKSWPVPKYKTNSLIFLFLILCWKKLVLIKTRGDSTKGKETWQ